MEEEEEVPEPLKPGVHGQQPVSWGLQGDGRIASPEIDVGLESEVTSQTVGHSGKSPPGHQLTHKHEQGVAGLGHPEHLGRPE